MQWREEEVWYRRFRLRLEELFGRLEEGRAFACCCVGVFLWTATVRRRRSSSTYVEAWIRVNIAHKTHLLVTHSLLKWLKKTGEGQTLLFQFWWFHAAAKQREIRISIVIARERRREEEREEEADGIASEFREPDLKQHRAGSLLLLITKRQWCWDFPSCSAPLLPLAPSRSRMAPPSSEPSRQPLWVLFPAAALSWCPTR